MLTLFILLAAFIIYIYIGYPIVMMVLGTLFKRPAKDTPPDDLPRVAFIISAFNEESVIGEKLDNTKRLKYPSDKLDIFVISDASDDNTDEIVNKYDHVFLKRMTERRGKTYGINEVVPQLDHDVVVFSDANAIYEENALMELVKFFGDPKVGYVVGYARYYDEERSQAGEQENAYWNFEVKLKEYESRLGSVVGGDGAIYAIRRRLFRHLEEDDINDFVNPLHIILQGYRGVFNPDAVCYEHTAENFEKELKRKRRIVNRSWRGLMKNAAVLNPFKTGLHAWQVFSHKFLRWLGGFFLIAFLAVNFLVLEHGDLPRWVLAAQLAFYSCGIIGAIGIKAGKNMPPPFSICYYFVAVNVVSLLGIWDNYNGKKYTTWQTIREES